MVIVRCKCVIDQSDRVQGSMFQVIVMDCVVLPGENVCVPGVSAVSRCSHRRGHPGAVPTQQRCVHLCKHLAQ